MHKHINRIILIHFIIFALKTLQGLVPHIDTSSNYLPYILFYETSGKIKLKGKKRKEKVRKKLFCYSFKSQEKERFIRNTLSLPYFQFFYKGKGEKSLLAFLHQHPIPTIGHFFLCTFSFLFLQYPNIRKLLLLFFSHFLTF